MGPACQRGGRAELAGLRVEGGVRAGPARGERTGPARVREVGEGRTGPVGFLGRVSEGFGLVPFLFLFYSISKTNKHV